MRASAVSQNDLSTESAAVFDDLPGGGGDDDDVFVFAWVYLELVAVEDALDAVAVLVVVRIALRYELVAMI